MKALLPAACLLCAAVAAVEIDPYPDEKDLVAELYELQEQMDDLTDQLRSDEHHDAVQVRGKEIEDKLNKLIDEIENAPLGPSVRGKSRRLQAQTAQGNKPQDKSRLPAPRPPPGSVIPRDIARVEQGKDASWYKLPPSKRGEVIQTWASEMPLKWKARIAAYFVSVSGEDK
jgi:hypothetical protein